MAKLKKKIAGSTLIETIVAMVIIMIILGISYAIMLNLKKHNDLNNKLHVYSILQHEFTKSKSEMKFNSETIEYENIFIVRSFDAYGKNKDARVLLLEAFNKQGEKVMEKTI